MYSVCREKLILIQQTVNQPDRLTRHECECAFVVMRYGLPYFLR